MSKWVEVDALDGFVSVITLSRPPVNALNRGLRMELLTVMDALRDDEKVHAIVLTGSGKVFCAGADIKEKSAQEAAAYSQTAMNRLIKDVFFTFLESEKPIIAAVNGAAVGAGFVLAACCDLILAAENAVFAMPEVDVGQGGGASILQSLLPKSLLRRLVLTGERIDAAELQRLGAIDSCWPSEHLLPAAISLARIIAAKDPNAVRSIRTSFSSVDALPKAEGFHAEQLYTTALSTSAAAAEARRRFFESRKQP